ncbi:MAG: hypothetical protein ACTSYA_11370 [Candidatus Kariarchaeaceae archaeon]
MYYEKELKITLQMAKRKDQISYAHMINPIESMGIQFAKAYSEELIKRNKEVKIALWLPRLEEIDKFTKIDKEKMNIPLPIRELLKENKIKKYSSTKEAPEDRTFKHEWKYLEFIFPGLTKLEFESPAKKVLEILTKLFNYLDTSFIAAIAIQTERQKIFVHSEKIILFPFEEEQRKELDELKEIIIEKIKEVEIYNCVPLLFIDGENYQEIPLTMRGSFNMRYKIVDPRRLLDGEMGKKGTMPKKIPELKKEMEEIGKRLEKLVKEDKYATNAKAFYFKFAEGGMELLKEAEEKEEKVKVRISPTMPPVTEIEVIEVLQERER